LLGHEDFARLGIALCQADDMHRRLGEEVVQRAEPGDHRRQRRWNLRRAHVGNVFLALYFEIVNLGVEGLAHLSRCSAEDQKSLARRRGVNFKAVTLQPLADYGDILIGHSVAGAHPLCTQPLMEKRRSLIVHLVDARLHRHFLLRSSLQEHDDVLHRQAVRHRAAVELSARQRMHVAWQRLEDRFIRFDGDAGLRHGGAIGVGRSSSSRHASAPGQAGQGGAEDEQAHRQRTQGAPENPSCRFSGDRSPGDVCLASAYPARAAVICAGGRSGQVCERRARSRADRLGHGDLPGKTAPPLKGAAAF
jgi:hypothetical protein